MDLLNVEEVRSLAADESLRVDARGARQRGRSTLTVIAEAGATATVSRVNSAQATEHIAGAGQFTVTGGEMEALPVDWPYYRISVANGGCRVALL
jgi:hypothetical protein